MQYPAVSHRIRRSLANRRATLPIFFLALLIYPLAFGSPYVISVGVLVLIYTALAISYDLIVGRVGAFSFAHAAFFGVGAYTSGILMTNYSVPFLATFVVALLLAGAIAVVTGIPSFRLSLHSFAMGTFGVGAILQLVALNWIPVTRGPLCLNAVPPLSISIGPLGWTAASTSDYYLVFALIAAVYAVIVWHTMRTRVGRALLAIREDPTLASSHGVPLLKYRMFAFTTSAAMAAGVGAATAPYLSVVCPTQLALPWMVALIVIVFLGGRSNLAGVIVGAVLFTALPEFLRVADVWREVIYGGAIMVGAIYMPDGVIHLTHYAWARRLAGVAVRHG